MKKFTITTIVAMLSLSSVPRTIKSMDPDVALIQHKQLIRKRQSEALYNTIGELNESIRIAARAANHLNEILTRAVNKNDTAETTTEKLISMRGAALTADKEIQTSREKIMQVLTSLMKQLKACSAKEEKEELEQLRRAMEADTIRDAEKYTEENYIARSMIKKAGNGSF